MTNTELKRKIVEAFDEAEPPSQIAAYSSWEAMETERAFKGRKWTEITPEEANYHPIFLLGPDAWRHYLGAYLLAALDDYKDVLNTTVHALRVKKDMSAVTSDPEKQREIQEKQDRCLAALSAKQKRVIHDFLKHAATDPRLSELLGGEAAEVLAEWDQLLV